MPTRGKSHPHRSRFLNDLVKISFKDGHFLANNGKSLCAVPSACMQELLSALRLVAYKNTDRTQQEAEHAKMDSVSLRAKPNIVVAEGEEEGSPIKVGQIFYLQFYFTGEFISYDHHNNKLILSQSQRTAFKIIEHIGKAATGSRDQQTYDYIGIELLTQATWCPISPDISSYWPTSSFTLSSPTITSTLVTLAMILRQLRREEHYFLRALAFSYRSARPLPSSFSLQVVLH